MIILLFFYFFVGNLTKTASINFTDKPNICAFNGNKGIEIENSNIPVTDPNAIPNECEVILLTGCQFICPLNYSCESDILDKVMGLNRPVILEVYQNYTKWMDVLKPDCNAAEAKALTDYATSIGALGVLLTGISPIHTEIRPNCEVAKNSIPYFKELKNSPNFVVGFLINPTYISNPCDINYDASGGFIDFYVISTYILNGKCKPELFNGATPIHETKDLIGLDTIVKRVKDSSIDVNKTYFVIDLLALNPILYPNYDVFTSYSEVCSGKFDVSQWCVPTTKDYYDMAKFIHDQNYGICIYWIELDDSQNTCGCNFFIGFSNIVAGYKDDPPLPCAKFDIKAVP